MGAESNPMKTSLHRHWSAAIFLVASALAIPLVAAEEKKPEKKEAARVVASIRVDHEVSPAELPGLAKISFMSYTS